MFVTLDNFPSPNVLINTPQDRIVWPQKLYVHTICCKKTWNLQLKATRLWDPLPLCMFLAASLTNKLDIALSQLTLYYVNRQAVVSVSCKESGKSFWKCLLWEMYSLSIKFADTNLLKGIKKKLSVFNFLVEKSGLMDIWQKY